MTTSNADKDVGKKWSSHTPWWECKMTQLEKVVRHFLKKLNRHLPHSLAPPLLDIYVSKDKEAHSSTKTWTQVVTAASFVSA